MPLRRALKLSALQTSIRLLLSFASVKLSAIFIGAPGLALTGQLSSFLVVTQAVLGNGPQTAVARFTPEYEDSPKQLTRLWGTSARLIGVFGGVLGLGIVTFSHPLAAVLLRSANYWYVIALGGLAVFLSAYNALLNGILNGLKHMSALVTCRIGANVLGFCCFAPLIYWMGLRGAFIGLVLTQGLAITVTLPIVLKATHLDLISFFTTWDRGKARLILKFFPMLVANTTGNQFSQIFVRGILAATLGIESAGLWQATWRVSEMYTMVITTALSIYLIPHLASLRDETRFKRELIRVMTKTSLLCAAMATLLFLLRHLMVQIVFTRRFMPMLHLYPYQLIGDVIMMAVRPLRMALVVKMRTILYVFVEFFGPGLMALLTYVMIPSVGLRAAPIAYIISNALLLAMLIVVHFSDISIRRVGTLSH